MSRAHKTANLIGVALPPAGLILAIVLLWNRAVGPLELIVLAVMYLITGIGITLGFHRMFTHRGLETSRPLKAILAVMGSMAVEGSVITWVADHRKHHAFTDVDGDPHSPHLSGPGFTGAIKGLWHAHVGWLFETVGQAERERFAPDLVKDPMIQRIDRLFPVWIVLSLAIPFGIGWAIGGGIGAAFICLLWAGAIRIVLLHHVTWSINSVCHFFGRRRFDVEDESTNVFWLAPFSLGEAWHHNHHAFPTSAFHGLSFWERLADPTGLLIASMERVGLVWNVVRVTPERQAAKLASAAKAAKVTAGKALPAPTTAP
jgi:stearoyl-CoA desaturase (delta-9 desaturase)